MSSPPSPSSSGFGSITSNLVAEVDGMHPLRRVGHLSIRRSSVALPLPQTIGEPLLVATERPASHVANVTRDADGVQTVELVPIPEAVVEVVSAFSWDSTPTDGTSTDGQPTPASPHLGWF